MGEEPHAFITWQDALSSSWLLCGLPAALLKAGARWTLARAAARLAGWGRVRARARADIARLGGFSAAQAKAVDRWLYTTLVASHFDVVRTLLRGPEFKIVYSGLEHLDAALEGGRGAILWVSDFAAAGDVTKVGLAGAGYRVSHLSRREHGFSESLFGIALLNPVRIMFERRFLGERVLFERARPARAMLHLARRLRANGVVSMSASAHEGRTLVEARFLNGRQKLAAGAPRLAVTTGAPLIPVFTVSRPGEPGTWDMLLGPPLVFARDAPGDEAELDATTEYLDQLEPHVRSRPECWVGWRRRHHFT